VPFNVDHQSLRLPPRPNLGGAIVIALAAILIVCSLRLGLINHGRSIPIGYSIFLIPFVYVRRPWLLWLTTLAFCVSHYVEIAVLDLNEARTSQNLAFDYALLVFNLVIITALIHVVILAVRSAERRGRLLTRTLAQLSAVWRTAPVGLCVADAKLEDFRFNPHGASLLFSAPDENVAMDVKSGRFQTWKDGKPVGLWETPLLKAAKDNVYVAPEEYEVAGPSGHRIPVLLAAAPVRLARSGGGLGARRDDSAEADAASGAVAAFVDLTAVKQLQRELDLRRREAEEASVRKSRFLSAVSHDIRTPANAISLLAELLAHAVVSPGMQEDVPKYAADLRASSAKLVDLVTDILDFSKLDTARVEVVETVFDLGGLLREEVGQAAVIAHSKNVHVQCQEPDPPIALRTDRVKLGRVIGNLLSNAVKFTNEGEVRVASERRATTELDSGGGLIITVMDTGIGIQAEDMERIFDEFYQVRSNTMSRDPARSGSGLGLAICQRLALAMGMRLTVQSEAGKGSVFTLAIPESAIATGARR
jgi:signal transduction histidine kinase